MGGEKKVSAIEGNRGFFDGGRLADGEGSSHDEEERDGATRSRMSDGAATYSGIFRR